MVPPRSRRRALLRGVGLTAVGLAGCSGLRAGVSTVTDTAPPDSATPRPTGDAVRWRTVLGGTVRHPPTLGGDAVYVGGGTNDRAESPDSLAPDTSENVYALAADDGTIRWRHEAAAGVVTPVAVKEGVYAVVGWDAGLRGVDQRLVRVDPGEPAWETDPVEGFLSVLALDGTSAYLGTSDDALRLEGEALFAVRTGDGTERWRVDAGDARTGTVDDGTLYALEGGRRTTAVATADGGERWHRDVAPAGGPPRVFGDTLYLEAGRRTDAGNYPLIAVAASDGRERWRFAASLEGPFLPTGAVAAGDAVYVTEYDGRLFALEPADGTECWRLSFGADTREPPALAGGAVYLTSLDGHLHAVEATSGDRRWRRDLPGGPHLADATAEGVVVYGRAGDGRYLRAYGHDGRERWSFVHPGGVTPPAVRGTRAYVGTAGGEVLALGVPR